MKRKNNSSNLFVRRSAYVLSLFLSFVIIFGLAFIVAYKSYMKAVQATIRSNETKATLLSKLILEHQRAAIGVLQSYAGRPLLVNAVKKRDFEKTLKHLIELAKLNPEMEWPFISNPDSTIWINYPVDWKVMNRDLSYRDWYKGVSKEWRPYISTVYKSLVGKKDLVVAVSVPIFDGKDNVIGILSTAQSTAFFQKIIGEAGSSSGTKINLIDQDSHIIYSNGFPYTKEIVGYQLLESVKKTLNGEKGNIQVCDASDRKRVKYVSFAPVEAFGWSIILERARSEVLRSEASYLALIGVIALFIYGFTILSLLRLRDRHRQIKELEKVNEELDKRVCERTAEIEAGNRALRDSEERFRILANAAFEGIVESESGRILDCNEQFADMMGCTVTEARGTAIADLIAPEDRDRVLANIQPNRESVIEHRMLCKDGTTLIVEAHGRSAMPGSARRYTAVRDITERKRAEEALRKSQEEYRHLVESSGSVILRADKNMRITFINEYGLQFFGYSRDELIGKRALGTIIPYKDEKGNDIAEMAEELMRRPDRYTTNIHQNMCKDGRFVWMSWTNKAICDDQGNLLEILAIGNDLSRLKETEEALRESEREFAVMFERAVIGMSLTDPATTRILRVNKTFSEMLGYSINELCQMTFVDITHPEDRERDLANYDLFRNGLTDKFHIEKRYIRKDGSIIWADVSSDIFTYESGRPYRTIAFIRDITDRKRSEEALRDSEAHFRLLSDTAARLLAANDPQGIIEELCREVMKHLDCHTFFNFLVDESVGRLRLNAYAGVTAEEAQKIEWLDYGVAVCGCVARDRNRIIAEDISHVPDPRTDLIKSFGIQAYCCHPLMVQGRLIGTLSFGTRNRPNFTPEEVDLMRTVTDQVAIAMQRIETERMLRQHTLKLQNLNETLEQRVKERTGELANLSAQLVTVQENERKRVSYDLHDHVWQMLLAIRFETERLFSGEEGRELAVIQNKSEKVADAMLETVAKIRSMQGDLWPYVLDDIGILATIDWFCREFEKGHAGINVKHRSNLKEHELPSSTKIVVYRILQETMSNIAKHSQANRVMLGLTKRDHGFELIIKDNGIGFDPEGTMIRNAPWGGLGLLTIKARTELSGGNFKIESAIGKGTTIRAFWSIQREIEFPEGVK